MTRRPIKPACAVAKARILRRKDAHGAGRPPYPLKGGRSPAQPRRSSHD